VAPSFYLAEAMSLAWLPHPPLRGMPVGEQALAYFEEAVARPWDVAHVAWALPFAVGAAVLSGLLGGWFARVATGQRQSAVGPRTAPPSADRSALQV
jgi:hypothetical protein